MVLLPELNVKLYKNIKYSKSILCFEEKKFNNINLCGEQKKPDIAVGLFLFRGLFCVLIL